ncbi:hypothetical protein O0L34_g5723 [Tuta absoluta]|nr:hypothetical protein O0L34_g5723 [Tuta absoluta]
MSATTTNKEKLVENKNETEFYRSYTEAPAPALHPQTSVERPEAGHSGDYQGFGPVLFTRSQLLKRLRRGCTRGCSNTSEPIVVPRKGHRIKMRVKPTRKPRPTHKRKSSGCKRPDGGCPYTRVSATAAAPARRMGIEEYPKHRPKHKPKPKTTASTKLAEDIERIKGALRSDNGSEELSQLFGEVITSYLEDKKAKEAANDEAVHQPIFRNRDPMQGVIIVYTTAPSTTVKPSVFRKIPIFLTLLKVIKAFLAFGVM